MIPAYIIPHELNGHIRNFLSFYVCKSEALLVRLPVTLLIILLIVLEDIG